MQVDAVFFDAAGTLICAHPSVGEVYAAALQNAGIDAEARLVQHEFEESWRRLRREHSPGGLPYGRTEAEAMEWWRRVVRESFKPFGLPDAFEELFQHLWRHFASAAAWRIYDDVWPAFDALQGRGKAIGLISNWDARLPGLLEQLSLRKRLRWVVVSCQVGAEKPDSRIFRRALGQCGLPPARVVHVGDSYEEDVVGARAVGIQAIWLRRGPVPGEPPEGVVTVRGLNEVLDTVD